MPTSPTTPRLRGGNRLLRVDFQGIPKLPAEEPMGTGEGRLIHLQLQPLGGGQRRWREALL